MLGTLEQNEVMQVEVVKEDLVSEVILNVKDHKVVNVGEVQQQVMVEVYVNFI